VSYEAKYVLSLPNMSSLEITMMSISMIECPLWDSHIHTFMDLGIIFITHVCHLGRYFHNIGVNNVFNVQARPSGLHFKV